MNQHESPQEIPVALLAQVLIDMKATHGEPTAMRKAVIVYFKSGIATGLALGDLVNWLFFWPNERHSAFGQMRFSQRDASEFVEMVKKIPTAKLESDETPPPSCHEVRTVQV